MLLTKDIITSSPPTSNINPVGPPPVTPPSLDPVVPVINGTNPEIISSPRPPILTILLSLFTIDFVCRTALGIFNILIIIKDSRANHLLAHIFEKSPGICFYPVFTAILAVYILFLIIKSSSFTRNSNRLLIISFVIVPLIFTFYNYYFSVSNLPLFASIFNEVTLFSVIIIIYLSLIPKIYTPSVIPLTFSQVAAFTIVASIILFPTFSFTYYLIDSSLNPDLNRQNIEKLVSHKLYYPQTLPQKLAVASQFFINTAVNTNLPESTVDIKFATPSLSLIISQTKVADNFNLANFAIGQTVVLPDALNQIGLSKSTPSSNSFSFITTDHILITLTNPDKNLTVDNLHDIARYLH